MKNYIAFYVAFVCWIAVTCEYTTKFDNLDVDNILSNDRLLNAYVRCILGKGVCTPAGTELKKLLPDALKTQCSDCNEKQKANSRKVLIYLLDNKPDVWSDLEKKYDPNGEYKSKFCADTANEGTNLKACAA